ncbi:hypothetical protein D3C80_1684490 [compost metagenome]
MQSPNMMPRPRRRFEPLSLMATATPKSTTATTATAWTTGPVIDWTTCCSGPSQGIPDPPATAGPAASRAQVIAAPPRRREHSPLMARFPVQGVSGRFRLIASLLIHTLSTVFIV